MERKQTMFTNWNAKIPGLSKFGSGNNLLRTSPVKVKILLASARLMLAAWLVKIKLRSTVGPMMKEKNWEIFGFSTSKPGLGPRSNSKKMQIIPDLEVDTL